MTIPNAPSLIVLIIVPVWFRNSPLWTCDETKEEGTDPVAHACSVRTVRTVRTGSPNAGPLLAS
jgi:hypothetical protein